MAAGEGEEPGKPRADVTLVPLPGCCSAELPPKPCSKPEDVDRRCATTWAASCLVNLSSDCDGCSRQWRGLQHLVPLFVVLLAPHALLSAYRRTMIVLGYWKIKGLAQSLRYVLCLSGTDYQEDAYETGDAPQYDRSQWLDVKHKMGLDFPNLPYLMDGDVKITQSLAILRYLGRKSGLCPRTEQGQTAADMLEGCWMDLKSSLVSLSYQSKDAFEAKKPAFLAKLPDALGQFDKYLMAHEAGTPFFVEGRLTYIDCLAYATLADLRALEPSCLGNFPLLAAFAKNFEQLSGFEKVPQNLPINGKSASFR